MGRYSSGISSKKQKVSSPFVFQASKIGITLYAPIETIQKKKTVTIDVLSGKTNKELIFDLSPFIIVGVCSNKYESEISSSLLDEEVVIHDEYFASELTLL